MKALLIASFIVSLFLVSGTLITIWLEVSEIGQAVSHKVVHFLLKQEDELLQYYKDQNNLLHAEKSDFQRQNHQLKELNKRLIYIIKSYSKCEGEEIVLTVNKQIAPKTYAYLRKIREVDG